MNARTKRTRNFIVVFSVSILTAWLILPRAIRHAVEPTAFAAATTFTVNVIGDGVDANPGDGLCLTSGNTCTLRAAIQEANANAGKDTINFNIPGAGVHTISPDTALPDITQAVVIDGNSQPGASANTLVNGDNAVLLIELNGSRTMSVNGLTIKTGNSTIQGLVINRFGTAGIEVDGQGNTIQGNFIGTNPAGNSAPGNTFRNVIVASDNNLVGGTTPAARNVISGAIVLSGIGPSGVGVEILFSQGNTVQGNFIGTDASGTVPLGNQGGGVVVESLNGTNLVGGTSAAARNVISGNGSYGIGALTATIQGNFIGTDVTGTIALGNT
ncbi:MAG TPA: CSLREA domain-containing protein, partial [Pyrinomonadaceae bacterium]|nr:CSLREA domain-containing protein [Pyrinomonadaceae bacterium]